MKTKKIFSKNTGFSVQYEAFSIVFCNFTSEKGKKNTFPCSKRYIQTQQKLRSDAVKNTSRRSICYVPTQQKIRPDVVKDTSGRNFGSVLVSIWKLFCIGNENGETLCYTLHMTIHLFQNFSPNKSSNPTSL